MTVRTLQLPSFRFEDGTELVDVPVAYQSWGQLNDAGDNAILVCHALTGNTAVDEWWRGMLGPGRALDTDQYFVICANVIGSPYGSLSPLTANPTTGQPYGIDFPIPTLRDTVSLHRLMLDELGVRQVEFAIGGSLGGMQVLEWAFQGDFVKALVPIGVGGQHSAWCIAWSQAQREAIRRDPAWQDGLYTSSPTNGLAVARMIAMISYRSFESFGERFGRESDDSGAITSFSMESYLRHQGKKFVERFDANCYLRLTQSMDTHDIARGRGEYPQVLHQIQQPTLVIGIDSDLLYPIAEQRELAEHIPHADLEVIEAAHGHDSFLIELDTLNGMVEQWHRRVIENP
jgi:homoserine O-acetyltransferase